jgi:phosphocarrier protein HPr
VIEQEVEIRNPLGLHARAAARFVRTASRYRSRVQVQRAGRIMDGKSILGMLLLAASAGTRLRLIVDGDDDREALAALATLVRDGFGEVGE